MPVNPSHPSPPPINSLSVGDAVSAGLRIYRDRFKLYFGLAFKAYLWVLVPIYGWAKFYAISALLSRLAYREVIEQPETVSEARDHVMPRMWRFLGAGLLVTLIYMGVLIGAYIIFALIGVAIFTIGQNNAAVAIIGVLLLIVGVIVFFVGFIRLIFRLFIYEVPLAIEENVTASSTISRSLQLTQGSSGRLQWIVLVAFLLTLPVSIVVQIATTIAQVALASIFPQDSTAFGLLYFLVVLVLSFASGSLLIPFWQAIKAVIYYDLRSRKEGIGLQIRDSHPQ